MVQTAPAEAYRKFDDLSKKHIDAEPDKKDAKQKQVRGDLLDIVRPMRGATEH